MGDIYSIGITLVANKHAERAAEMHACDMKDQ